MTYISELWQILWHNNGELWFLGLGFYLFEFGRLVQALRYGEAVYRRSLKLMRYPRLRINRSPSQPIESAPRGIYELADYCEKYHNVIPVEYFKRVYASGVDYDQSFNGDLSNFVLIVKTYLGGLRFLLSTLSSLVLVAGLLWVMSLLLQGVVWNFRGMIIVMLVVQWIYVSYVKYSLLMELRADLSGEASDNNRSGDGQEHSILSREWLRIIGCDQGWIRAEFRQYWRQRAAFHQGFYESADLIHHEEMTLVADMFHKQNMMKQSYSWLNVSQAVAMIIVFFVQNFAI